MKPVVSSLVALCLALVPAYAMAAPAEKPSPTLTKSHHKVGKASPNHHKTGKVEQPLEPVAHKSEPTKPGQVKVIPAALSSKPKTEPKVSVSEPKKDLPKLPAPSVAVSHKAQKADREKSAPRKASSKKDSSDKDGGQAARDEGNAELVARVRGTGLEKVAQKDALDDARCRKAPVEIIRGPETDTFPLMKCDGKPAPLAVEHLSILIRPGNADRPTLPLEDLAKHRGKDLAKGIKRVDPGLASRLQALADHFSKTGTMAKFSIISGYRPASIGSMHQSGRAVDFRLEGAKNEEVVAFCKTLVDTGCGFYPNSSFVHMDVRETGSGHTSWIDASGPGEIPKYVHAWPLPSDEADEADAEAKDDLTSEKSEKAKKTDAVEKTSLEVPAREAHANARDTDLAKE